MARAPMAGDCPLTTNDYNDIQRALDALNRHRIRCEEAKRAGLDVDADIKMNDHYRDQFAALKATYFPQKK